MSDSAAEKEEAPKKPGWLKAIVGTVAGVMSGAAMMYLSPILDRVIKPAKPVANFAVDMQGLTVVFHNRSLAKGTGWWDFGDGSPLEPATVQQESISHTYPKAGTYTVKLSVRNVLNDESERTVTINLDATNNAPPAIMSLDAIPVSPASYAPATFRLLTKTKNANLAIWVLDEERPLEIVRRPGDNQDRLVTFDKPGGYIVKLVAVNGEQTVEKDVILQVQEPPTGVLTAVLHVTEQMTQVETSERIVPITEVFTATQGNTQPISRQIPARQGYEITAASLEPVNSSIVRNAQVKVAPDRPAVVLTAELLKETGLLVKNKPQSQVTMRVRLTEEQRTVQRHPAVPVTTSLTVPGSTVVTIPGIPCDCCDLQREFRLELRDGDRVLWQESRMPREAPVTVQGRRFALTATPIGDQIRIDLREIRLGEHVMANQE